MAQYVVNDKWQKLFKDSVDILQNLCWPGQGMFMLDKFILVHRNYFVVMTQCDQHVNYQLTNKITRVNFHINAIECKDPGMNATIEIVKGNKGKTRNMNTLKDAAAYLTTWDHVANN